MAGSRYYSIPDATLAGSVLLAYFSDRFLPMTRIIPSPLNLAGWAVVAAGLGLALCTLSLLRSEHTSTDPGGVPSTLITSGPFSRSRNPMYLAYVITASGAAMGFGSLSAFSAPVLCFAVLHLLIIPVEERKLHTVFGQEYEHYQRSVHRWL